MTAGDASIEPDARYIEPRLVAEFDRQQNEPGLDPTTIPRWSNKVRFWICPLAHPYDREVAKRSRGQGCPICAGVRVLAGFNDFATHRPELVAEWDNENNDRGPDEVTTWSGWVAQWICPKGHPYPAPVRRRAAGHGCSVCSGRRVLPGVNDLATLRPDLAAEMVGDPTTVTRGSNARVTWRCTLGHTWPATVKNRAGNDSGCPVCSGHQVLAGFNDLLSQRPDIAAQWDTSPGRNTKGPDEVTVSSHHKAGWLCPAGHRWNAEVSGRTGKEAKGCRDCSLAGTSRAEQELHALLAESWPQAQHRSRVKVAGRRRAYEVDIVWENVAVEYDGSYFHQGEAAEQRDLAKTQDLLDAGFSVVRVREQNNHRLAPLPLRHPRLAQVDYQYGTDQCPLAEQIVAWAERHLPEAATKADTDVTRRGGDYHDEQAP